MELVVGVVLILFSVYHVTSFTRELKKDEHLVIFGGYVYGCGGMVFLYGCLFVVEFFWEMMK